MDKDHTKADAWAALTLVFFGFGGLALLLAENTVAGHISNVLSAMAALICMLGGPYALLMAAAEYSGKMPADLRSRFVVMVCAVLPLIAYCVLFPALDIFGKTAPPNLETIYLLILAVLMFPYYVAACMLFIWNLVHSSDSISHSENLSLVAIAVPPSLAYYVLGYVLPSIGYNDARSFTLLIIIAISAMFIVFVTHKGIFGLSVHGNGRERNRMEAAVLDGTDAPQYAMKSSLLHVVEALEAAESDYASTGSARYAMPDVKNALDALDSSIAVLDNYRLMLNPVHLDAAPCDLGALVDDAIEKTRAEYPGMEFGIEAYHLSKVRPTCDAAYLREALACLIRNSIEALPDDGSGKVFVSVEQLRRWALVRVRDNGRGIDRKHERQMGMPFFTTKDRTIHPGLGLYYADRIATLHNGWLIIGRSSPSGTTVELFLPCPRRA